MGLLDERFFAYDEDIDWCLRARRAGWKVRFWPGVSMVHLGAGSAQHLRDKTGLMFRSHVTYLRKNHGRAAAAAFYLAMGLKLFLATAKQVLRLLAGRGTRAEIRERWQRMLSFMTLRPAAARA